MHGDPRRNPQRSTEKPTETHRGPENFDSSKINHIKVANTSTLTTVFSNFFPLCSVEHAKNSWWYCNNYLGTCIIIQICLWISRLIPLTELIVKSHLPPQVRFNRIYLDRIPRRFWGPEACINNLVLPIEWEVVSYKMSSTVLPTSKILWTAML